MTSWDKKNLTLKPGHKWKAKPGCKILVTDQGAVRFDVPEAWIVIPATDSVKIHDKQPPDDDCALAVSHVRLPPIDWTGLPIVKLLSDSTKQIGLHVPKTGAIVEQRRADLAIAWREIHFIDDKEQRPAISRILVGRRKLIQCLITFDFWLTDLDRCNPVWSTVLDTLTLGEFVTDPTTGR